jgi:hypothetical protein
VSHCICPGRRHLGLKNNTQSMAVRIHSFLPHTYMQPCVITSVPEVDGNQVEI